MNYAYSNDGENWIGEYTSRDSAIVAGVIPCEKDGQTSWRCYIGTVVLPHEILEREKHVWMGALIRSMQNILEEEMPWVDAPMEFPDEARDELSRIILKSVKSTATFRGGFAVENVEHVVLQEQTREEAP